ncbi:MULTISPECIES: DNA cytosine methyltransferase [unclassified Brevundimonas]|uniref:DNA cytosine methyltransferase n=1 Tax=unclassified Brevundimonas TaxID=2622653 RepID=UPI0025C4194D|nr:MULTISPECIES: DNA cytosine methyltransferase [unclassified Brevundimonas]
MESAPLPAFTPSSSHLGTVVDLFCGAGGLAHGFRLEGFKVAAGIDVDERCRYAFEHNNKAPFIRKDIASMEAKELAELFPANQPSILVGCAPCQPFSTYNQKNEDPNYTLVGKYGNLITAVKPDIVSMENVPRLLDFKGGEIFRSFVSKLKKDGYKVWHDVVYAPDYGVPQRRKRLVLLASRYGAIELEGPSHTADAYLTVADAIGELAPLDAGQIDATDPLHRASALSPLNMRRIIASKPGGTWHDWDKDLRAACHVAESGHGYRSVYGRMKSDEPSPTITTQFYGFGNGRFGHPTQHRALSLREGAILQSFPPSYAFHAPGERIHFTRLGRLIGNAVPVKLSRAIARSIKTHLGASNVWVSNSN